MTEDAGPGPWPWETFGMALIALTGFLLSLVFSLALTRLAIAVAPRLGLVDHPGERKVHQRVTPLGGGVAIYLAVMLTMSVVVGAAWLAHWSEAFASCLPELARVHAAGVRSTSGLLGLIVVASTVQMAVGLADDLRPQGLSYQARLVIEVGLVLALVLADVRLTLFTDSWLVTVPITVLWVVGLTNALNFLDNMDALSGGVAFLASVFFAIITALLGDLFVLGCFLVLAGALLGFLRYNWGPAKIFMGDAGSNFLGFWLGTLTVVGTFHTSGYGHVTVLAPLCVLAVPIYDSTSVILLRLAQGRSPFQPDKQHFSHRLVALGFRPKNAVMLIYLVTVTTAIGGVLLYYVPPRAAMLALAQVVCTLGIVALLEVAAYRQSQLLKENDSK